MPRITHPKQITPLHPMKITNDYDACIKALALAIVANSEQRAQDAFKLAEHFAAAITPVELESAKAEASRIAAMYPSRGWEAAMDRAYLPPPRNPQNN